MAKKIDKLLELRKAAETARFAFKKADRTWFKAVNALTGPDWRRLVDQIEDMDTRIQVAHVIWWDYFGGDNVTRRKNHLDKYLSQWREDLDTTPLKVRRALTRLGFPDYKLKTRFMNVTFDVEGE